MSVLRKLAAASLGAGISLVVVSSGCGVDVVGVQDCRDVEFARCEAGHACGVVSDVAECKRFYRDHCLHGLSLKQEPSSIAVKGCVNSLKAVSSCNPKGRALADCPGVTSTESTAAQACDVVNAPETIHECQFLVPEPPAPVQDAASDHSDGATSDGASDASPD